MVINEECKKCQIKRNVDKYPDNVSKKEILINILLMQQKER